MNNPLLNSVKSMVKISSIFVAFLENMNFKDNAPSESNVSYSAMFGVPNYRNQKLPKG